MTGVSLSTIKRKRVAGDFPNAEQDEHGTWLIPVEDLLGAGLHLNSVTQIRHSVTRVSGVGQRGLTQTSDPSQLDDEELDLRRLLEISELRRQVAEAERDGFRTTAESERKRADDLAYVIRHQLAASSNHSADQMQESPHQRIETEKAEATPTRVSSEPAVEPAPPTKVSRFRKWLRVRT